MGLSTEALTVFLRLESRCDSWWWWLDLRFWYFLPLSFTGLLSATSGTCLEFLYSAWIYSLLGPIVFNYSGATGVGAWSFVKLRLALLDIGLWSTISWTLNFEELLTRDSLSLSLPLLPSFLPFLSFLSSAVILDLSVSGACLNEGGILYCNFSKSKSGRSHGLWLMLRIVISMASKMGANFSFKSC